MSETFPIKRGGTVPLREQVLHHCRKLLMRGQFLPGQKLPLRPLAEEFKTSLMPVRDALNTLVADGALEITSGRTVRVPQMAEERIVELHEIRSALEGLAARYATRELSAGAIDRAEQLITEMEQAFENESYDAYIDAHFSFHFTIYEAAGRPTLRNLIETLWLQLGPSFRQGIERAREANETAPAAGDPNHNHRLAIQALRARDATAMRNAIEQDVMTGVEFYKSGRWLAKT